METNLEKLANQVKSGGDSPFFGSFNDFGTRDMNYYQSQQPTGFHQPRTISANSFPPIGQFTMESALSSPQQQQPPAQQGQQMFNNDGSAASIGIFGQNNMMARNGTSNNMFHGNGTTGPGDQSQGTRETGIIEKLLHSYGFIQCCERQARLFFHFSQFTGNIEHLKIGDPVEFEMTYDRRTGKPIASQVTKIAPEVVLSEERVTGTVTTELKNDSNMHSISVSNDTTGRISYENRGECFFLPYTKDDVEGNVILSAGDKVSFQIATNQRGNLGACHIRLENPVHPVKYRGVVCSMKESFGFIERADVVKEIFFHFSEADGSIELRPGDDVEFIIQTRNGKEVACNIARLSPGSVVFEDVDTKLYKGQVLKPLDRNGIVVRQQNDPLPGRIRYRAADYSEVEVPFGDKDQKGDFTLRHGDWVQFYLATDRRDQLQRATSIALLEETFHVSGEKREQGVVASLKEGFGFLRCVERNVRLFFHFTEVLDTNREICVGDEVEFTVIQDPDSSFSNTKHSAIRIKHLPEGSVQFETLIQSNVEGLVTREAPKSPIKSQERTEGGVITYEEPDGGKKTIMYFLKDCEKAPRVGDKIRFNICQVKRNKELIATNIQEIYQTNNTNNTNIIPMNNNAINNQAIKLQATNENGIRVISKTSASTNKNASHNGNNNGGQPKYKIQQGFIAVLKEHFGFIETINQDQEVFFHFSNFIGNTSSLELGDEVEYTLSSRNGLNSGNCIPAENVKVLAKGTIIQPKVLEEIYQGVVVRPLRCINPDQSEYCGLIQIKTDANESISTHQFGITGLSNKRDLLQKDDVVSFKLDANGRAVEICAVRQKKKSFVDSIKGQFGFLDYEVEEGKKLFFHISEVQDNATLNPGDSVEFSIVTNQRNGKTSACNVVKVASDFAAARPERFLSRLKITTSDTGPRLTVIRAPKGPDGTKGFVFDRTPRRSGEYFD